MRECEVESVWRCEEMRFWGIKGMRICGFEDVRGVKVWGSYLRTWWGSRYSQWDSPAGIGVCCSCCIYCRAGGGGRGNSSWVCTCPPAYPRQGRRRNTGNWRLKQTGQLVLGLMASGQKVESDWKVAAARQGDARRNCSEPWPDVISQMARNVSSCSAANKIGTNSQVQ